VRFGLTEEQQLLQETVRGFVARECPPPRLRELFDAGAGHDPALWKGLAEMGVTGLIVPESYGGAGLELLELALVMEAGAVPTPIVGHALACLAIQLAGSDAQRARWLPDLASGARIATVAWAERGDAWDPESWGVAFEAGALHGAKRHVAHAALANLIVVGARGGRFAVVERGAPGMRAEDERGADRTRPIAELSFAATPAEPLGDAPADAARVRDAALVLLAADAFGAAWQLVRTTTEYAKTRQQFGKPIGIYQAVSHRVADMLVLTESSKSATYYSAWAVEADAPDRALAASMAKAYVSDAYRKVTGDGIQVHGGIGFTWEHDVQLYFKRAKSSEVTLGDATYHRELVAQALDL
jgi:alkylation response protein AidB-like acyl-CoA dehydrogenase